MSERCLRMRIDSNERQNGMPLILTSAAFIAGRCWRAKENEPYVYGPLEVSAALGGRDRS